MSLYISQALRISQLQLAEQKVQKAELNEKLIDAGSHKAGKRRQQPVVVADGASNIPDSESASATSTASRGNPSRSRTKEKTNEQRAVAIGKKFGFLFRPWLRTSALEALGDSRPNIDPNS